MASSSRRRLSGRSAGPFWASLFFDAYRRNLQLTTDRYNGGMYVVEYTGG